MEPKLNSEILEALQAAGESPVRVIDPQTNRSFVIVDEETHRRAMDALRQAKDREAVAQGIAEMEAGEGEPLAESMESIRSRLKADYGK